MDDATGDVQPRLAQPTKRVQQPHSSGIIAYGPLRPQNEPSEHPLTDSPTHMTSQFSSGALGDSQSRFHRDPSDFRRAHHYPYHAQLGPATSDIANDRIDPRLYTGHPQTSSSHDPVMQPSSSPPFAPSSSFAHVSPTYPLQHSSPDAPPASAMHGVTSNEETAASLAFHPSHTYYSHPNSSPPHFENDGHPGEPRYRQSSSESEPGSPESSPLADDNPSSLAKGARRPYSCPYEYCGSTFERPSTLKQHIRMHTGEKPFGCRFCGKHFSVNSNLRRHQKNCVELPQYPIEPNTQFILYNWPAQASQPSESTHPTALRPSPHSSQGYHPSHTAYSDNYDHLPSSSHHPRSSSSRGP